jgi:hypothetical protein
MVRCFQCRESFYDIPRGSAREKGFFRMMDTVRDPNPKCCTKFYLCSVQCVLEYEYESYIFKLIDFDIRRDSGKVNLNWQQREIVEHMKNKWMETYNYHLHSFNAIVSPMLKSNALKEFAKGTGVTPKAIVPYELSPQGMYDPHTKKIKGSSIKAPRTNPGIRHYIVTGKPEPYHVMTEIPTVVVVYGEPVPVEGVGHFDWAEDSDDDLSIEETSVVIPS